MGRKDRRVPKFVRAMDTLLFPDHAYNNSIKASKMFGTSATAAHNMAGEGGGWGDVADAGWSDVAETGWGSEDTNDGNSGFGSIDAKAEQEFSAATAAEVQVEDKN